MKSVNYCEEEFSRVLFYSWSSATVFPRLAPKSFIEQTRLVAPHLLLASGFKASCEISCGLKAVSEHAAHITEVLA